MILDKDDAIRSLVAAARELLLDQSRFIELTRVMGRLSASIDPDRRDEVLTTFLAIDSESDGIVVGAALDAWAPELRPLKEQEAQRFVKTYREVALRDAKVLIDRYGDAA
jgi:hypothetical protein